MKVIENINFLALIIFIAWYILPLSKAYFSGMLANIVMVGMLGIFFITAFMLNSKEFFKSGKHSLIVIICIICYVVNMVIRRDVGNAIGYAKVGIIFWIPVIMSNMFLHYYDDSKKRKLIIFFIICFILTTIPTMIELTKDQGAIRALTYGGIDTVEDYARIKNNVGTFSYVYGLAILIPFFVYLFKENKNKKWLLLILVLSIITLIEASFTIGMIIAVIGCIILYLNNNKHSVQKKLIIVLISVLLIVIFITYLPNLLIYIGNNIENEYFQQRFLEIANFIDNPENSAEGDLAGRIELYTKSFKTFLEHPIIGVGGYYYIENNNPGIGYHSEILDNMARYGIFSLVFVIAFFYYYRKYLLQISKSTKAKKIINTIIFSIIILAFINPCFNNEWISIIVFVLLPTYCSLEEGKNEENSKNII